MHFVADAGEEPEGVDPRVLVGESHRLRLQEKVIDIGWGRWHWRMRNTAASGIWYRDAIGLLCHGWHGLELRDHIT